MMYNKYLNKITVFFIFFPFIGFVPSVDIQPLALVFLSVLTLISVRTYDKYSVLFLIFTLFCILFVSLVHQSFISKSHISFFAFIFTSFFTYNLVKNNKFIISNRFVFVVIILYVLVGLVQLFQPSFLEFLVSRQNSSLLSNSGRGVKSLTSEPSVFGSVLILLNILYIYTYFIQKEGVLTKASLNNLFYLSFVLLVYSAIIIQSLFSLVIHFSALIFIFVTCRKSFLLYFSLPIFFLVFFLDFDSLSGRFFTVLNIITNNPDLLFQQGAMARVLNIPISVQAAYHHGIFGAGFSPVYPVTVVLFDGAYEVSILNRNLGGLVEVLLMLGVASFPIYILYLYFLLKISMMKVVIGRSSTKIGVSFSLIFLFISFNNGSIASPLLWFVFFFVALNASKRHSILRTDF